LLLIFSHFMSTTLHFIFDRFSISLLFHPFFSVFFLSSLIRGSGRDEAFPRMRGTSPRENGTPEVEHPPTRTAIPMNGHADDEAWFSSRASSCPEPGRARDASRRQDYRDTI